MATIEERLAFLETRMNNVVTTVRATKARVDELENKIADLGMEVPTEPVPEPEPTPVPTPKPIPEPVPAPTGWKLRYETRFSDLNGWTVYDKQTQSNDNSINLAKNVTAGSRGLVIVSKRESGYSRPFTSGEVVGKSSNIVVPNYFRAEVTGTFKDEVGVWPCLLWFRPQSGGDGSNGEIDVMEWMGGMWTGTQKRVAVTMHNEYGSTQDSIKRPLIVGSNTWYNPDVAHTYLIEKVPGSITVTIDNRWTAKFGPSDKSWWNRIMEARDRTWYPRITSQIGDGASAGGKKIVPNPLSTWNNTELTVTSFKTWDVA